jgi:hypothetical protein
MLGAPASARAPSLPPGFAAAAAPPPRAPGPAVAAAARGPQHHVAMRLRRAPGAQLPDLLIGLLILLQVAAEPTVSSETRRLYVTAPGRRRRRRGSCSGGRRLCRCHAPRAQSSEYRRPEGPGPSLGPSCAFRPTSPIPLVDALRPCCPRGPLRPPIAPTPSLSSDSRSFHGPPATASFSN